MKRCVALPGDTLTVKDGLVYINSVQQEVYPGIQLSYKVVTNGQRINSKVLEKLGLNIGELYYDPALPGYPEMPLTAAMLEKVKDMPGIVGAEPNIETYPSADAYGIFPFSPDYRWTRDWFGPLWIPKKGETVELDTDNLPLYERIITAYEKNDLKVNDEGMIFINGKEVYSYTFQQDYYFMMGDNRHNSLDSRYWGFVPEDHIVGRPSVIWLSTNRNAKFPKNIRWRRFLKFV